MSHFLGFKKSNDFLRDLSETTTSEKNPPFINLPYTKKLARNIEWKVKAKNKSK
jgi:hypothetical protein